MTDDKNKNPENEIEEEFADFEDDFAEEGLEEDFHEDGEEFVEEDWEGYDEEGDFPIADEGGKKSSKFLVIVGGLVLLVGGGYAAMQFMGGAPAVPTQGVLPETDDVADALPMPGTGGVSGNNDNSAITAADSGKASQNEMSPSLADQDFTPPPSDPELDFEMPMPFSNNNEPEDTASAGEDATGTAPASADVDREPLTPLPQDNGTTDKATGLMASGASAENMQNNTTAAKSDSGSNIPTRSVQDFDAVASESPQSPHSAAIDSSALESLESKLDRLFNRLDTIESELDQVKKSDSGSDINELQSKIRKLEREINNMDARSSSAGSTSSASTSPKNASPASKQVSRVADTGSEMSAKDWILTSAQPGKATLRKAGGNDVISVEIGDSVAGLGRVISIGFEGGKWVVKATSGHISQ